MRQVDVVIGQRCHHRGSGENQGINALAFKQLDITLAQAVTATVHGRFVQRGHINQAVTGRGFAVQYPLFIDAFDIGAGNAGLHVLNGHLGMVTGQVLFHAGVGFSHHHREADRLVQRHQLRVGDLDQGDAVLTQYRQRALHHLGGIAVHVFPEFSGNAKAQLVEADRRQRKLVSDHRIKQCQVSHAQRHRAYGVTGFGNGNHAFARVTAPAWTQ